MGRRIVDSIISSYYSPTVDNFVFRLCYRWTVWILITFTIIVTCKLMIRSSFTCMTNYDAQSRPYIEAKCYFEPLYSSLDTLIKVSSPGDKLNGDVNIYHTFYPWVNLVLLTQAFIFYLPHLLWKTYESGFIGRITAGLQLPLGEEKKRSLELHCLAKYVLQIRGKHKLYTSVYLFFEICNFVIAIGQAFWLVDFFNVTNIPDNVILDFSTWSEYNNFYFPSSGKCKVPMLSASGTQMSITALCALPMNQLYVKMYLFLRAWYIFLAFATAAVLVYRIALFASCLRVAVIRCLAPFLQKSTAAALCHQMSYGDWFFLTAIRSSIPELEFSKLLDKMLAISQNKINNLKALEEDEENSTVCNLGDKEVLTLTTNTPL